MIEVKSSFKPVISCATSMMKKMQVYMNSFLVKQARENVIEFLLINHPLDCPICDQGSECDLQDQAMIFGSDRGRFAEIKRSVQDLFMGPVVKTIMTRCIHCTRCVRFSDEIIGNNTLGTLGRGKMTEIGTYYKKPFIDELSGNVVDLCPVGALTSKSYAFKARAWELKSIESIDIFDGLGSNIRVDIKGNEIMRILPKRNDYINEEWITDKIRFSYEGLKKHRIIYPMLRVSKSDPLTISSYSFFFTELINRMNFHLISNNNNISNLFSVELSSYFTSAIDYYIINNIFPYLGINTINSSSSIINNNDFRSNYLLNSNLNKFENDSLYLLNNINLKKENPVLNSRLKRLKVNNGNNVQVSYIGSNINLNYDFFHISNNSSSFYNILEGKHYYSYNLHKNKSKRIINGINSFNYDKFSHLNTYLTKYNISYSNIIPSSSLLTYLDMGYLNNNNFYNINDSFKIYYLYNTETFNNRYKNSLELIYHGTNINEEIKKISTFILPSTSIFENKLLFSNLLGFSQNTNISVSSIPNQFFSISELFLNLNNDLFKLIFKLVNKENSNLVHVITSVMRCNNLIKNNGFIDIYPYYNINNYFDSKLFTLNFNENVILNYKFMSEFLDDYYKTDNVSLNSDTLYKSSLLINNQKNNFFKNLLVYQYVL
jgi:NADH dehydrogenase (ubiquinone) Fe-S protein 1